MNKPHLSLPMRALLFFLSVVVVAVLSTAAFLFWGLKYYHSPGENKEITTVYIPKGMGFNDIISLLHDHGVLEHPKVFSVIAIAQDKVSKVKAGEYEFPVEVSPKDVLESLVEGRTVIHRLTVPEGLTTHQVLEMVANDEKLQGSMPNDFQEGELLPSTYYYSRGDSRGELLNRMRKEMRSLLMELWEKRAPDLPLRTPQEAITLASIVEKETGVAHEYGLVASVYINRLKQGMLLQADPTTIYAITQGKEPLGRNLRYSDLRLKHPYNTYTTLGLPPGPIANPGKQALEAVLNPTPSDYIFFVADGSGGHKFSKNYSDHSRYVNEYRSRMERMKEETLKAEKAQATRLAATKKAAEQAAAEEASAGEASTKTELSAVKQGESAKTTEEAIAPPVAAPAE